MLGIFTDLFSLRSFVACRNGETHPKLPSLTDTAMPYLVTIFHPLMIVTNYETQLNIGIATGYKLEGRGSNPGGRRDFPYPSKPDLKPNELVYNGNRVFPGDRTAGALR
jgi:hypothetical protein